MKDQYTQRHDNNAISYNLDSLSASPSLSFATGGNSNNHIDTPTRANAVLVIIQASPTQTPPHSNPIWNTFVMERLAITFPTDCSSSIIVNTRAVSSRLTRTVSSARIRKMNPAPDACKAMLRMKVGMLGERLMPNVPKVRQRTLPRAR